MIEGLKPDHPSYLKYFAKLTDIPRCSGQEEAVGDYLLAWAKERGLEAKRDGALNVIIKKPASPGYEDRPPVILQGHMDMVCEARNLGGPIDFSCDPIWAEIKGDIVVAPETTLGADNGIAVAMIQALFDEEDLAHPPLEALITSDEEEGMTGAINLDGSLLEGKRLINLDSEEEGVACVGCAGGQTDRVMFLGDYKEDSRPYFYWLGVEGGQGGHSGMEINKQRANAIRVLARYLLRLDFQEGLDLVTIEGGNKTNAIPLEAQALVATDLDQEEMEEVLNPIIEGFFSEYEDIDPDLAFSIVEADPGRVMTDRLKEAILTYLNLAPNGIIHLDESDPSQVTASANLGVLESRREGWQAISLIRSSSASRIRGIGDKNRALAQALGGTYSQEGYYPPWEYEKDSPLRETAKEVWKDMTGEDLKTQIIHAGLECAILPEALGEIDMVSIGPNIYGVHAPGEHFSISSASRVYDFVRAFLREL